MRLLLQLVDAALRAAGGEVLATPVVTGEVELIQPKVMYLYKDEALEALSPFQKHHQPDDEWWNGRQQHGQRLVRILYA